MGDSELNSKDSSIIAATLERLTAITENNAEHVTAMKVDQQYVREDMKKMSSSIIKMADSIIESNIAHTKYEQQQIAFTEKVESDKLALEQRFLDNMAVIVKTQDKLVDKCDYISGQVQLHDMELLNKAEKDDLKPVIIRVSNLENVNEFNKGESSANSKWRNWFSNNWWNLISFMLMVCIFGSTMYVMWLKIKGD